MPGMVPLYRHKILRGDPLKSEAEYSRPNLQGREHRRIFDGGKTKFGSRFWPKGESQHALYKNGSQISEIGWVRAREKLTQKYFSSFLEIKRYRGKILSFYVLTPLDTAFKTHLSSTFWSSFAIMLKIVVFCCQIYGRRFEPAVFWGYIPCASILKEHHSPK